MRIADSAARPFSLLLLVLASVAAQDPAQRFGLVPINGAHLYYETAGTGSAVVLLHGGWLNSRQWDEQFHALSRAYRVIRYDHRGAGRSTLGDGTYAHYDDLAALLKTLGVERAHLVGLSAGAQIAIDFTLTYPQAVRSLVIGASPLRGYDLGPEFLDGMRGVVSAGVADDPQLTHDRMWAFAPFAVASRIPRVRAQLNAMIVHGNTWAASRPAAPKPRPLDPPPAKRLAEIKVPTLIVVGDGEMPALKKEAEFVAGGIPNARLVTVNGAGHFVNLEQPDEYTALVAKWLSQFSE